MSLLTPDQVGQIHEPEKVVEAKPRRRLMAYDRLKVLLIIAIWLFFQVQLKHSSIPIISWGDSIRDVLAGKTWLLLLVAAEITRQLHYYASEQSGPYHQWWTTKVWGGWDKFWTKRNPWLRFRMARLVKRLFWFFVVMTAFASLWGLPFLEAVAQAPHRFFFNPFGAQQPWFFQILFTLAFGILQFVGIFWFMSRGGVETYMPEDIKTRFTDVWGQDKVLDKIRENIIFLDRPEEIEAKGGHVPSGILLWGPPGTGKTLIAEAVAGETSKPFVFVDPGSFKAMFVGVGVMKVKALYKKLRKLALRYGGVIVFFDEADTLGSRGGVSDGSGGMGKASLLSEPQCNGMHYTSGAMHNMLGAIDEDRFSAEPVAAAKRGLLAKVNQIVMGGMGGGAMDGSLQAILAEMSGLKKPKAGIWRWMRNFLSMPPKAPPKYRILTIMATNMPDSLDPALLRPGRIDRKYHVTYPLLEGRIKTFEGYLKKVRHEITPAQIESLATRSSRVSGAEVKDIVNEALIGAMRRGRDFVSWQDLLEARVFKIFGVPDGVAATRLEQYETALHEACHTVASYRLLKRDVIDTVTIEKRGAVGGFQWTVPVEERDFDWKADLEVDIMVSLASRAGERMFFDDENSVGVGGDLHSASATMQRMVLNAGMYDSISTFTGALGPKRRDAIDDQVEVELQKLYERVRELLTENAMLVLAISHALVCRRTITGEDVAAIEHGTMGVVLDGSWYHSATNRSALERFHLSAREAHRSRMPKVVLNVPPLPAMPTNQTLPSPPPPIPGAPNFS